MNLVQRSSIVTCLMQYLKKRPKGKNILWKWLTAEPEALAFSKPKSFVE